MENNGTASNGQAKRKVGRPSIRTAENAGAICVRLINGESLRRICQDENLPSITAVIEWLADDPEFAAQYARARELQAEYLADEILDIADDSTNDFMEDKDGNEYCDYENIQRSRLRVDARKWVAAKLLPKKYGDKPAETHLTTVTNNFVVLTEEALRQLQARRAEALR